MTENSKHTPGPWRRVHRHPDETHSASIAYIEGVGRRSPLEICTVYGCDRDAENSANADLIAEAGTVLHETGLTPRQLAEQRAALLAALRPFAALLGWHHADTPDDRPLFGINDAVFTAGDLRAAAASIARAEGKP